MRVSEFPLMAHDINAVGLGYLRDYIKRKHPRSAPKLERNIAMLKYLVRYGYAETSKLFCMDKNSIKYIATRYWQYAKEAADEKERIRQEVAAAAQRRQLSKLYNGAAAND